MIGDLQYDSFYPAVFLISFYFRAYQLGFFHFLYFRYITFLSVPHGFSLVLSLHTTDYFREYTGKLPIN
jgi:hypothetical protein